jgi:hypothetical protein
MQHVATCPSFEGDTDLMVVWGRLAGAAVRRWLFKVRGTAEQPMIERVVAAMQERGLTTEDDFLGVKGELLEEHGEDAFASALLERN